MVFHMLKTVEAGRGCSQSCAWPATAWRGAAIIGVDGADERAWPSVGTHLFYVLHERVIASSPNSAADPYRQPSPLGAPAKSDSQLTSLAGTSPRVSPEREPHISPHRDPNREPAVPHAKSGASRRRHAGHGRLAAVR